MPRKKTSWLQPERWFADAKKDEDVGVARLNGIIEHHEGMSMSARSRGSSTGVQKRYGRTKLLEVTGLGMVAAVGLEAWIALKSAGRNPTCSLAPGKASLKRRSTGSTVRS
jgi:predicted transcriptional regulator